MQKLKFIVLASLLLISLSFSKAIGPNNFYKTIRSHKVVLVKFWAPWCGPCSMLKPEFEKAQKIAGKKVLFATYNIDLQGEPLRRYNINVIPTMVLFVDGKEVSRSNSILSYKDIAEWVLGYVP
jgi:thioredoxin